LIWGRHRAPTTFLLPLWVRIKLVRNWLLDPLPAKLCWMPRRRHRGGGSHGASTIIDDEVDGQADRTERIAVFERTKMCKFHILGVCTKGQSCRFAHDRMELQSLPDLQRTKLCKTLISTGECTNPACRYAHNKEELRFMPGMQNTPQIPIACNQELAPRAAPMPAPDPGMPKSAVHQVAFDSAMQAAIMQVGQAAQAHAVEAARLQALAAQLQAGGIGAGAMCGTTPFFSGGAFVGAGLDPEAFAEQMGPNAPYADPATHDLLLGLGETTAVQGLPVWRSEQSSMAPADVHSTVAAGAEPEAGDGWATAMSRVLGDEPVQIRPETLRSLSSNSLVLLAGGTDDESFPGTPEGPTPQAMSKRQGYLLRKVSEESTCQGAEKRSQDTPLSDDEPEDIKANLAEAVGADPSSLQRSSPDVGEHPTTSALPLAAHTQANSDADSTERIAEGGHDTQDGTLDGSDLAPGADAEEDDVGRRSMTASLAETLSASGITVKNTFLDFKPQEARTALRSVQTAAGRLDLMWQE